MPGGRHRRTVFGVARFTPADAAPDPSLGRPVPVPTDPQIIESIVGGKPDPAVDAIAARVAGDPEAAAEADARAQAQAALYADAPVRPGGIAPRWGCALSAHEHLGWCANCPHVTGSAELSAWRLVAAGHPAPDLKWAIGVSR